MTDLSLSLLVKAIDQFSGPAQKMAGVSDKMAEKFSTGQKALNDLGKTGKLVQGLAAGQKKLGQTAAAMDAAKKETARLGRELANTEKPTSALQRKFETIRKRSDHLRQSHRRQKDELNTLRGELRGAGVDTRRLGEAQKQVATDLDRTTKKMEKMAQVGAKMAKSQANYEKSLQRAANVALVAGGMQNVGRTALNVVQSPLAEMRKTERAKGELQSLGIEDTDSIIKAGQQMAKTFAGIDTAQFVSAAYDIKSGISTLDDTGVADMTRVAALTAKATKANVAQMTSLFATGHGSFKKSLYQGTSDKAFGEIFASSLSASVQMFKTDGSKMQQSIQSMGSGLAEAGISMTDQFTALGMLQQKMEAGVSGTALAGLERTAAQAQKRFDKLGLSISVLNDDGNLRALPDLLEEMQTAFGEDYTTEIGSTLQEGFGSEEAVKFFKGLWGQQDAFRKNALAVEAAQKRGLGHTTEMAKNMDRNMDARIVVMEQRWGVIKEKLGHAMVPVLEMLIPLIEKGVHWFDKFVEGNSSLTTGIMATIGVVGGVAVVVAPVIMAVATLSTTLAWLGLQARKANSSLAMRDLANDIGGKGKKGKRRGFKGRLGGMAKGLGSKVGLAGAATVGAFTISSTLMNDKMSVGEKAASISQDVGGIGGAAGGALLGATLGSVVPVIGTAIGSVIGGIIGGWGGDLVGSQVAKLFVGGDDEKMMASAEAGKPQAAEGGAKTTQITKLSIEKRDNDKSPNFEMPLSQNEGIELPAPIDFKQVPAVIAPQPVQNTTTIHIQQQPGQDPQELAEAMTRELNRQQRGALYD